MKTLYEKVKYSENETQGQHLPEELNSKYRLLLLFTFMENLILGIFFKQNYSITQLNNLKIKEGTYNGFTLKFLSLEFRYCH